RTTVAARPSGGACNGELQRPRLPLLPPRRREALPEGRALLHAQMRDRASRVRARHARPGAQAQDVRLRPAAPREAEGPPHLRVAREAVPQLSRPGVEGAGRDRNQPPAPPGVAARQRDLPAWFVHVAQAGAAATDALALP